MSNATREVKSKTLITLDTNDAGQVAFESEFQKEDTLTSQLRQVVTTTSYYPAKKVSNEMNGGLFGAEEFGFAEQVFTSTENRVAWIPVPKTVTEAQIKAKLDAANKAGACIYRVLSSAPIISKDQQWSIDTGRRSLDSFANAQVMRYPEGHDEEGKLILNNDKVQYRKTFFSETAKEDIDMRGTTEEYHSTEIEAELKGASTFAGQTVN